jgi:hypothetical protein
VHRPIGEQGEDRRPHVAAPAAPAAAPGTPAPAPPAAPHVARTREAGEARETGRAGPGAAAERRLRWERSVCLWGTEVVLRPEDLARVAERRLPAVMMVFSVSK